MTGEISTTLAMNWPKLVEDRGKITVRSVERSVESFSIEKSGKFDKERWTTCLF